MDTYGLIGFPLGHSFSKKYFTDKFKKENIDAKFNNFELENIEEFPVLLSENKNIKGLSVTIPHKEKIIHYLDSLSPEAKSTGAVNSIKITREQGNIITVGYNTDIYGFQHSLLPFIKSTNLKALILGTGGAAKAVAYALSQCNINHVFVSRTPKENEISYNEVKNYINNHKLIINTTPLGMHPNIESHPNIPYEALSDDYYLFDLTYNPEVTTFLAKGKEKGAHIINGLKMLHLQAERSWEIWNK